MSKRAQKIIKQIVGSENNYKRLLPIKEVILGHPQGETWMYEPEEDYYRDFSNDNRMRKIYLTVEDEKLIDKLFQDHLIDYTKFYTITDMQDEVREYIEIAFEYNNWVPFHPDVQQHWGDYPGGYSHDPENDGIHTGYMHSSIDHNHGGYVGPTDPSGTSAILNSFTSNHYCSMGAPPNVCNNFCGTSFGLPINQTCPGGFDANCVSVGDYTHSVCECTCYGAPSGGF